MMNVKVKLPSGKTMEYPSGTIVKEIISDDEFRQTKYPVVAAWVDNEITSLSYKIMVNCSIRGITLESRQGTNIYRRSLCFLLNLTSRVLFPERRLVISHSLGKGFLYYYEGFREIPAEDIEKLKKRMQEIVKLDLPITRNVVSYADAVSYFRDNNQPDTLLLLKYRNDSKIPVYTCGDFIDLSYGPLVPSTGALNVFEIMNYPPGFLLRYFSFGSPEKIDSFRENPVLFSIYREYKNWGKILNVPCVGALNELITEGKSKEFIQVSEALHSKKIAEIADKIANRGTDTRIILIAGPSSSGKTTFAKKLAIQLRIFGYKPVNLSVDNYFHPHDKAPRDAEGNFNFESVEAIDIELFNQHMASLLKGEEVEIPSYSFVSGTRKWEGFRLKLGEMGILICEGIHLLNERLSSQVKKENKFKIYVSALTQLNLDDHNRISTTDNRLIRRMVRDNQFRGYSAFQTLRMWQSVRKGEARNIFPFQNSADTAFNSALDYELAVLKVYAEPLLKTIKPDMDVYDDARLLLLFLNNFIPLTSSWVPSESILREFIGDSSFKY